MKTLRDRKYGELISATARNKKLANDLDCSLSQVQRIVKGELGTSVDTIEDLARVFLVRPQDMLTPYFTAEEINPPLQPAPTPAQPKRPARRRAG